MKDLRCAMVYNAVATTPSGGLYPCCRCTYDNMYYGDPKDYFESDYLNKMKSQMENGVWPDICRTCQGREDAGLLSKRQRRNEEWLRRGHTMDDLKSHNKVERVDLRLSNLCNLACCGCNGKDSSLIKDETIKFIDIAPKHFKQALSSFGSKDFRTPYSEEHIEQLIDLIDPYSEVYVTGGEPSLIKGVNRLLEKLIDKGYNETISLQFNSNFSAFNQKWIDLISQFGGHMMPSIDAVGTVAEYARYGCKWDRVDENVKEFLRSSSDRWKTTIFVTPSVMNIFNMKDLFTWYYTELKPIVSSKYELNISVENIMTRPPYFELCILSNATKEHIFRDIQFIRSNFKLNRGIHRDLDEIEKHMTLNPRGTVKEMVDAFESFDKMRGTNWKSTFPELKHYYELEYGNE